MERIRIARRLTAVAATIGLGFSMMPDLAIAAGTDLPAAGVAAFAPKVSGRLEPTPFPSVRVTANGTGQRHKVIQQQL